MSDRSLLPIERTLALLAATPARFAELTAGLTPAQLRAAPSPGEWSANEVLAHVRACADVRGEPIYQIIAEDHPTFRAVNPLTWIKQTNYLDLDFASSLRAFAAQRAGLLAALEPLKPEGWERAATVAGAGAPLTRTVHFYAQWVARHERPHVKQIASIAATLRGA
ncbi:MAG TPA: DinB family protein [Ktedonobacterales bacterium]